MAGKNLPRKDWLVRIELKARSNLGNTSHPHVRIWPDTFQSLARIWILIWTCGCGLKALPTTVKCFNTTIGPKIVVRIPLLVTL